MTSSSSHLGLIFPQHTKSMWNYAKKAEDSCHYFQNQNLLPQKKKKRIKTFLAAAHKLTWTCRLSLQIWLSALHKVLNCLNSSSKMPRFVASDNTNPSKLYDSVISKGSVFTKAQQFSVCGGNCTTETLPGYTITIVQTRNKNITILKQNILPENLSIQENNC